MKIFRKKDSTAKKGFCGPVPVRNAHQCFLKVDMLIFPSNVSCIKCTKHPVNTLILFLIGCSFLWKSVMIMIWVIVEYKRGLLHI